MRIKINQITRVGFVLDDVLRDRAVAVLAGRPADIDVTTSLVDHVKIPREIRWLFAFAKTDVARSLWSKYGVCRVATRRMETSERVGFYDANRSTGTYFIRRAGTWRRERIKLNGRVAKRASVHYDNYAKRDNVIHAENTKKTGNIIEIVSS